MSQKHQARRKFLQGMGAMAALPLLNLFSTPRRPVGMPAAPRFLSPPKSKYARILAEKSKNWSVKSPAASAKIKRD
jgi:hypothetical protein